MIIKPLLRQPPTFRTRPLWIPSRCRNQYMHQTSHTRSSTLVGATSIHNTSGQPSDTQVPHPPTAPTLPPLSLLTLPTLLRSYLITAISSSPILLTPSLWCLSLLVRSQSPFFQVEHNRFLHYIVKKTIYAQFCAGETPSEVQRTATELRKTGYEGIVLNYAKEIVFDKGAPLGDLDSDETKDVEAWRQGMLETVALVSRGDCAALKFSGAGPSVVKTLTGKLPPSAGIRQATTAVCEYAQKNGIKLLFDAEQSAVQPGIDQWTLDLQREYNRNGFAVVYGTYQAYATSTPSTLARHLTIAQQEGFALGIKLVRGAYMASDPRHLFWATKAETDRVYDSIAEALMRREWNETLSPVGGKGEQHPAFPNISLVLATHNHQSVRKALAIRQEQCRKGEEQIDIAYAQLMGMADDLGTELIVAGTGSPDTRHGKTGTSKTFKYTAWGSVRECLTYLLRRAEENKESLGRTRIGRLALGKELQRRLLWKA
ncbi:MAG: hypothetical protein Q9213_002844 [Squamulea squamosa]